MLCYHALSPRWEAALSTTPERFEAQVTKLAGRGYEAATFADAVLDPPHRRTMAITFDDAYSSVLDLAKPILDRLGLVATVFAPTDFIGDAPAPMSWPGIDNWIGTEHERELAPMSWAQLSGLAAGGWEIGSHTRSHPHLTGVDDAALEDELAGSRAEVERRLGLPCRTLAYPYGDHDRRVVAASREAGYAACGTLPSPLPRPGDPHAYPRVGVYNRDDLRRFSLKVSPAVRRVRSIGAAG